MTQYKVLTLWEPWASLLVYNEKCHETRPKPTNWTSDKGSYLIHSALKWSKMQYNLSGTEPFLSSLSKLPVSGVDTEFPLGYIIGSIEVVGCFKIIGIDKDLANVVRLDGHRSFFAGHIKEISFGDYSEGRYLWVCQNPRVLKTPIPYKNGQGYYQNFKGDKSQLIFL
jgi:hypothetical protein